MRGDKSKPAIVYMATNRNNGKRYIGVTRFPIMQRARYHAFCARQGKNNGAFHRAIRKYGPGVFDWAVLERCDNCFIALEREIALIAALKPEYNSTKGGDGRLGGGMTEDGRRRISEAHKGKQRRLGSTHTPEVRQLLREIGLNNKGTWEKFSHMGPQALARCVVCITDGTVHDSASAAALAYGIAKSAVIEVCLGKKYRKTAGGKVFRYFGEHHGGKTESDSVVNAPRANSKTGLKGVEAHVSGKWKATIRVRGKSHYLGLFATPDAARSAYVEAECRLRGSGCG